MYTTRNTTTSIDEATGQHLSSSPIYIITDGFNPYIIQNLKEDPLIGHRIYEVPDNKTIRWVVGNIMLGALSSVFIGTPTSSMSGNIARARTALGFDVKTNYLRPLEQAHNDSDVWEFLYDCDNMDAIPTCV
eukprot:15338558-Ditylum_brightwellii.AAC.1